MDFHVFLKEEYELSESTAKGYVGRLNGMIAKQIIPTDKEIKPSLEKAIEMNFPNSSNHYKLAMKRYIEFLKRIEENKCQK